MIKILQHASPEALEQIRDEMRIRRTSEVFLLFNFGSQFTHLIAQLMARLGLYCIVADPATVSADHVRLIRPKGIILSGGPGSMVDDRPAFDTGIFDLKIPVLGICLGFQLWADFMGCMVRHASKKEFNRHPLKIVDHESHLLSGVPDGSLVMESHGDAVDPGINMVTLATTENTAVAAGESGHLYGVQFHPEIIDPRVGLTSGERIFRNFCFDICGATEGFPAQSVAEERITQLAGQLANKTVLLALSGGSDSAVVLHLLLEASKRVPINIQAVYIKGLDTEENERHIVKNFGALPGLSFRVCQGTQLFLHALRGVEDMAEKRLMIRSAYVRLLQAEIATAAMHPDFIVQGTLYTDICESGGGHDASGVVRARIKLHHNVGLRFSIPEIMPLSDQVKDTARCIGREIGMSDDLLLRQPMSGPGLAVRISGEVTAGRLDISRCAEDILHQELVAADLYREVWQSGTYLTREMHTCSQGDDKGSGFILMWWAVYSVNGFTAQAADLSHGFRQKVCRRFENEIPEVGAVVYRDSGKPRATIEVG
jgi:GMP synthase (glutamine-hydrolysing)